MSEDDPVVLVVEDELSLVEIYSHWLGDEYEVWSAENGEEALEVVDDTVDIMILDRLMPGMTGDEVIELVRNRDLDCMIVMATAVEPDLDVISIGADSYLVKPVGRDDLLTTVSRVLDRQRYAALEQELFRLVSKRATLTASRNERVLQKNDEYTQLEARIDELHDQLDERHDMMDDIEFVSMIRDINRAKGSVD
jgi:two-component system response regulator AdeR